MAPGPSWKLVAQSTPSCPPGYRLGIGNDHSLTQELQSYIEGLRRRQSKRAKVVAQRKQQPEEETL